MAILLIVAGLMALFGGFVVLKGVQSVRAPRNYPGALMYWDEPPEEGFGRDPAGWWAVLIHRLALVLLGILALSLVVLRPPSGPSLPAGTGISASLTDLISIGAVGMIGFTWGVSLFGPLAERFGGRHHYGVAAEGLFIGGNLLPWSALSHFDLDVTHNLVYIWSASLPGSLAMTAVPSEPGAAARLAGILREHLPSSSPSAAVASGKWALPVRMALLCLVFMGVAAWLAGVPLTLMLVADAFLMWGLQLAGAALIDHLLYGNKARPVLFIP